MKRNPLYVFDNLQSTGIYNVPVDSTIQINDVDSQGTPKIIQLTSKEGLTPDSTIAHFLSLNDNYVDLNEATEIPSELEKIEQNGKIGWRILGREETDYGPIGKEAFDFSKAFNITDPSANYGATGDYSFAEGYRTKAVGWASHAEGLGTIALGKASHAMGLYNVGQNPNNILEIGCGLGIGTRENALEITTDGEITAPNLSINKINNKGQQSLVTKEYSDQNLNSKVNKAGDTITGNLYVIGDNPSFDYSFTNEGLALFKNGVTLEKTIKIGLNSSFNSEIIFTDNNQNLNPSIYWSDTYKDFYIKNSIRPDNKIWHSGNDGENSELSAGYLGTYRWDEIAPKTYVDNGLESKFDKIGGQITGDVSIDGDLLVFGRTQTQSLRILDNVVVDGTSTFRQQVICDTNFISNSRVYLNELYAASGTIKTISDIEFNKSYFNDIPEFAFGLFIKSNNGKSSVDFENPNTGNNTSIFWSTTDNAFMVTDSDGNDYKLYHGGELPPSSGVSEFDQLTDTPSSKVGNSQKYLRVSTDESTLYYDELDATQIIDDTAGNNITDKTWSANKIYDELLTKLNINGGSISGSLAISNNLTVNVDAYIANSLQVDGGLAADTFTSNEVDFLGKVVISNDLNVNSITRTQGLFIYADSNNNDRSSIAFEELANPVGVKPALYWDNTDELFKIDDNYGIGQELWHNGNLNLDGFVRTDQQNSFAELNYFNGGLDVTQYPLTTDELEVKLGRIFIGPDGNYESGIECDDYDTSTTPPTATGDIPRFYWDPNAKQWAVNAWDFLNQDANGDPDPVFSQNLRVWHMGNFNPDTKFEVIGGDIFGDVHIQASPTNNGNGDLTVDGDLTVGGAVVYDDIGTVNLTVSGNVSFDGTETGDQDFSIAGDVRITIDSDEVNFNGTQIFMNNLPTSDPGNSGQLWNDAGTLKISL